ncbi:flagellar basal body protein, partial [Buchnera aphidicola]|nr:flagellar basal body protein [Buchnera aphidicola]
MNNTIYNITQSASQLLDKQAVIANNLANISTNSFKEKFVYFIKSPKNTKD